MLPGVLMHSVDTGECGKIFPIPEKKGMGITLYNNSGATTVVGGIYLIQVAQTADAEAQAVAVATTNFRVYTAIALEAVAVAAIGKFQISGLAEVLCDEQSGITAGKWLEVLNGTIVAVEDGAARTTVSIGILKDAVTADEGDANNRIIKTVVLTGEPHTIAAS